MPRFGPALDDLTTHIRVTSRFMLRAISARLGLVQKSSSCLRCKATYWVWTNEPELAWLYCHPCHNIARYDLRGALSLCEDSLRGAVCLHEAP